MNEWRRLLSFADHHPGSTPLALATLVRRTGSSYRLPGARMLFDSEGTYEGCLSGGCLEDQLAEVAGEVLKLQTPRLLEIDTRPHYGCPGQLTILIEPLLQGKDTPLFQKIRHALDQRRSFHLQVEDVKNNWATRLSYPDTSTNSMLFHQYLEPPLRLLIAGWTSDSDPLCELADRLDWEVCRIVPTSELLPGLRTYGHSQAQVCPPESLPAMFTPDQGTAVVIMTHHMVKDFAYLKSAAAHAYPYIGLLGSKRRRESLLAELGELGLLADETVAERLHAPVGLDIGADTPATIAVSILAEIQAVWHHRKGGFLKTRMGAIHPVVSAPLPL